MSYIYHLHFKAYPVEGEAFDSTAVIGMGKPLRLAKTILELEQSHIDQYGLKDCTLLQWQLLNSPAAQPMAAATFVDTTGPALLRIEQRLARIEQRPSAEMFLGQLKDLARHLGAPAAPEPSRPRVPELYHLDGTQWDDFRGYLGAVNRARTLVDLKVATFDALMRLDQIGATSTDYDPVPGVVGELTRAAGVCLKHFGSAVGAA